MVLTTSVESRPWTCSLALCREAFRYPSTLRTLRVRSSSVCASASKPSTRFKRQGRQHTCRPFLFLALCAREVGRVVRVARSLVFDDLRIGAERAREFHALLRIQIGNVFGGHNRAGCNPLLHPLFKRGIDVVLRVGGGTRLLAKRVRSRSAAAMLHSRNQIEAQEIAGLARSNCAQHAVVIINRVEWRDCRVIPAVIDNQLSSSCPERLQVRIGGVYVAGLLLVISLKIGIKIKCFEVPVWIVEHHVFKEIGGKGVLQALARRRAGDPRDPASRPILCARHPAYIQRLAL